MMLSGFETVRRRFIGTVCVREFYSQEKQMLIWRNGPDRRSPVLNLVLDNSNVQAEQTGALSRTDRKATMVQLADESHLDCDLTLGL